MGYFKNKQIVEQEKFEHKVLPDSDYKDASEYDTGMAEYNDDFVGADESDRLPVDADFEPHLTELTF